MSSTVTLDRSVSLARRSILRRSSLLVLVGLSGLAIFPAWISLFSVWDRVVDYSHGYLIAVIAAGWLYVRSDRLPASNQRPAALAVIALVGGLLAWLIAWKAGIAIGMQLLVPPLMVLAVWVAFGQRAALKCAGPIAYLYFAIPVWEVFVPLLQQMTVAATEGLLGAFQVPVQIDGVQVTIPEGRFIVEEGCSGRHFLIVSLAVSTLLTGIWSLRGWRACAFLAITVVLAILSNWIRVSIIVYAGHASRMQSYLVAREHVSLGWLIFVVLLALVYFIGARLAGPLKPDPTASDAGTAEPASMAWQPLLVAAGLLAFALLAMMYATHQAAPYAPGRITLPAIESGEWRGPLPPRLNWTAEYAGASAQRHVAYENGDAAVDVFVAEYANQQPSGKLIQSTNSLGGEGWTVRRSGSIEADGERLLAQVVEDDTGAQRLIAYVYQVGPSITISATRAQLLYGARSWFLSTPARVIALATPCVNQCVDEQAQLAALWKTARSALFARPKSGS